MSLVPLRGEVWMAEFDPVRGHEQAGRRPALIVSVDDFNRGPADLAVVLPITSKRKNIASHVAVVPPEGGLTRPSFIKCEDVRSISTERLSARLGRVSAATLVEVENWLRILLNL